MATLHILTVLLLFAFNVRCNENALHDPLPHLCDAVKCPPLSQINCPDDSSVIVNFHATISSGNVTTVATNIDIDFNAVIDEESYARCCLTKKCICKTCYIPDCHGDKDEVVVELLPESMETPGRCCGQYECQREPNCGAVGETEHYWFRDCQRCRCYAGERICHQICDEGIIGKKPKAICNSKNMNTLYEHGDSWKDGCYECECVNGESKCVMPFCRGINCTTERQVTLKDSCCPICWPDGAPMPYEDNGLISNDEKRKETHNVQNYYDEDEEPLAPLPQPTNADYVENEIDTLPNVKFDGSEEDEQQVAIAMPVDVQPTANTTSSATTTTKNGGTTATKPATTAATITCPPAAANIEVARQSTPTTYQLYPEVVEVVRQTCNNDKILYAVIGLLVICLLAAISCNIRLRCKQRSYRPVSIDDNFNKMKFNIKKTNDYV